MDSEFNRLDITHQRTKGISISAVIGFKRLNPETETSYSSKTNGIHSPCYLKCKRITRRSDNEEKIYGISGSSFISPVMIYSGAAYP